MVWPFRRRFKDLVTRQLSLFDEEHHELVASARIALSEYHANRDVREAQEKYADHEDDAEDVEEFLYDMCSGFASTLEDEKAEAAYIREFDRQARRAYGDLIPRLRFDR